MASSSGGGGCKYDVFISFHGNDTRRIFVDHLHRALQQKTLKTFIDSEGDSISELLDAIEGSSLSIVVLSENYASSIWLLRELVQIMDCNFYNAQMVSPVFYQVDPSDVHEIKGKFSQAFTKHEENPNLDKELQVKRWRSALTRVADLSGWDSRNYKDDGKLIEEIVESTFRRLMHTSSSQANGLVGMDSHIREMMSRLCLEVNDVRVVGIWGIGGLGKTAIARAVFDKIAWQCEHSCFLDNVKEAFKNKHEVQKQEELLSILLNEKVQTLGLNRGRNILKERLGTRKVLVVLDDVETNLEIEALLGNPHAFGQGSRVIVTTRDKQSLTAVDETYKPMCLRDDEALELFRRNAFKSNQSNADYDHLSQRAIEYAHGLPLALKVLGAFLNNKSVREWEATLQKLKKIPLIDVHNVLQTSFDGLDNSEKDIFLDIACLFRGWYMDSVMEIPDSCGFIPSVGMKVLCDRGLITVNEDGEVDMHDLLQYMGREIVRQESTEEPGKRSRVWSYEDVRHVLTKNTATDAVECLILDLSKSNVEICIHHEAFIRMEKLRLLIIYYSVGYIFDYDVVDTSREDLCPVAGCAQHLSGELEFLSHELRFLLWHGCPLKSLPSTFIPQNLVRLDMRGSHLQQLWEGIKPLPLQNLKVIMLSHCQSLVKIPDLTEAINLQRLYLDDCSRLIELHSSVFALQNLVYLNLKSCKSLKSLPGSIQLKSLRRLLLNGCSKLEKFPEISGIMKELTELRIDGTAIKELPSSIHLLMGIEELSMRNCESLEFLPNSICNLTKLAHLDLFGCSVLHNLPEKLGDLKSLRVLDVQDSGIKQLPFSIPRLRRKLDRSSSVENIVNLGAFEATRQATIETEPSMLESSEDVFSDTLSEYGEETTQATDEIEPKPIEGFEAVEETRQDTNGISESAPPQWKHDVFVSFRGEDTRGSFLSHLYHELQNTKVIRTFKDDEQLEKGKNISQSLLTAIEESRFAIIVLSENYAFSAWCLDELTKIFQCMEHKHTILPIFFHVDPSDVRHQENKFEVAFIKHSSDGRYDMGKVKQWRADLTKVGNLSGWDSKSYKSERELIVDIVKFVLKKVTQAPREDFEEFIATREAMDEVKKMLEDDKITTIGVYGRGGVGKTVMVKHVSAEAKRIGHFDHVAMAVVSRNPDLGKIQGALVNQLGLEMVEEEEIERASRLKERIMGGKRLLIILDDIQEKIDVSSIGIPSHEELQRCNSKVILTTRMRKICHSMGCQSHIPLNCLSEEDSMKFFMRKSRRPSHGSIDEERNAVSECVGLPSVIEEAARAFGHKYEKEWSEAVSKAFTDNDVELQEAAQEPNASQLVHNKDERDTFERIELSYHTLRFDDAKSFLLLCCMFPEDYDISIEELLKYGIGKGLFQYFDTLQEARDRAHSLVAYLKASGLLLDGQKGCLRMHSDVRKVAMSIAFSEGYAIFVKSGCELKHWPMDAHHEGYSAISLMRNELNSLPEILVCPLLQILLLQSNAGIYHIPSTLFQSPNSLRVFDLSCTSISVLPSSFDLLTNLQALYLDSCKKLTDISVLGKLKKVEILSLRKFAQKELPKEIGNLTSLRMLDVTGGCVHKVPSKVISRLSSLEELYMKCQFGDWGSKVEEAVGKTNAEFDEIIGLLRLNILKVYISDAACLPKDIGYSEPNWVKFDICLSRNLSTEMILSPNDQPARFLTLDRTINGLSDWFINVVTQKAEKLEYRECKGLNNMLSEYEHGRLYGLKHLSVIGCHEMEELINTTTWDPNKPVFESLEELHVSHLKCLKELCVGDLPVGSLCNLKLMKVQTCSNLVNTLLPSKLLQRLAHLGKIFCVNMKRMKYVFGSEGLEPGTILLTKVSEMRLCALSELRSIWNGPAPPAVFLHLKVLAVCMCTELKSLLPFDVARSLVQLEDLSVVNCPNLGSVIEASNSLSRYVVFLGLKKLALINLPQLTWFCTENCAFDSKCPSLEYLYVDECPRFINSASTCVKLNDPQHLCSLEKRWEDMYNQ